MCVCVCETAFRLQLRTQPEAVLLLLWSVNIANYCYSKHQCRKIFMPLLLLLELTTKCADKHLQIAKLCKVCEI